MSEYTKIEKDMYSKDDSAHIKMEPEDYDKFVDSQAKAYHKSRQKAWQKGYLENYKSRFGKKKDRSSLNLGVK
jgi:hypothetical protein